MQQKQTDFYIFLFHTVINKIYAAVDVYFVYLNYIILILSRWKSQNLVLHSPRRQKALRRLRRRRQT